LRPSHANACPPGDKLGRQAEAQSGPQPRGRPHSAEQQSSKVFLEPLPARGRHWGRLISHTQSLGGSAKTGAGRKFVEISEFLQKSKISAKIAEIA